MVTLAIDAAIIAIVAFCGWRGYKSGLIRGAFGVVALIASLLVANIAASAYSGEFTEMLKPFIGGIVETTIAEMGEEEDIEPDTIESESESEELKTAYTALRRIGLPDTAAARVAELSTDDFDLEAYLPDLIADKLSSVLAYVAVFAIGFILLAIVFAVIGNLVGVVFSLPGLDILDKILGALLGLAKGLLIVYTLAAVARYAGLIAPEITEGTTVLKYLIVNNPIAEILGN
jgi:uncharacterized membrane protein required for colicin V production